jgi:hypothetical protein
VLEYAAVIVSLLGCYHHFLTNKESIPDPHPTFHLRCDNTQGEAWAKKGCKTAAIGRALSRIQAALMIGNPVGYTLGRISTTDNVVADDISRIPCESQTHSAFVKLCTQHHRLTGCRRYQPNPVLISSLMAALLQSECAEPIALSKVLLTDPGRFIS